MHKNITISSFKKIPKGLLLVLILLLLTESFVYSNRAELIKDYWNKFLINEHNLIELPKDYDWLIIGDSLQKTGINPTLVNDNLLNLGLPGGKPMGLYVLLRRYLKKHKPPKAIFLYIDAEDSRDSLFVILRYFVSIPEFISIWKDLTWKERQVFLMRYWASLDMRKVGLTIRDEYPYGNETFIETMIKNRGFMPSPGASNVISDDYFTTHKGRYQSKITISQRDMEYLDRFIHLAFTKNIKIVFLGFFLPKELHDIFEELGFNNDYLLFIEGLKRRYPDAYFVRHPILHLENKYFGDVQHLNSEGSNLYTTYFKNRIFRPFSNDDGK